MEVPSRPYELLIYGRDGWIQTREFASLPAAFTAAQSLRPALTLSYRLSVVLDAVAL
jgi:hypothetical protein